MSSLLEQAIVDAQALREAALKNAEQSVIEKYAPEIKAAVESLLEGDNKQEVIKEEYDIPYAADPVDEAQNVEMVVEYEFNPEDFSLDLNSLQDGPEQGTEAPEMDMGMETPAATEEAAPAGTEGGLEDLLAESDLDEENDLVSEILAILEESDEDEEEVVEEGLTVDVGAEKHGWITTDDATRKYDQELELAKRQSDEYKEKADKLTGELEGLKNSLATYQTNQDKLHGAIADMKDKLEEALISNARLLYTNKVLSDASLNERQKSKLVEVIAKAETIKEAKSMYETLKEATVGANKKSPQSLSESVNRRSNLSHVMPRRKQETLNENHSFTDRMKKLAGID
ncbi:MAG: hypothetical protein GOVbin1807_95 [Prokaryotic dsDNA virus sp.]|nr:MAG: hypothetical protein GOVbin1807_95 [Prokaryotic dsDNA virus sp.]|tara:strand:- start:834 stop:1862 length:1029 start_codon:yes stop_codon:yes gene_type:complete